MFRTLMRRVPEEQGLRARLPELSGVATTLHPGPLGDNGTPAEEFDVGWLVMRRIITD
jgi:hypothetical protein